MLIPPLVKLLALVAVAAPAIASAEVTDDTLAPPRDAVAAPPPRDPIAELRTVAGSSRGFLMDTGLTMPGGTAELSLRTVAPAIGLATLTGGITDSTELWAEAAIAIDTEGLAVYGAGLKQRIASGPNYSIAVAGGLRHFDIDTDGARMAQLGAVGTVSTDGGALLLSGSIAVLWAADDEAVPMYSVGLSAGDRTTRFVAEYESIGRELRFGFLGVRFGRSDIQAELGGMAIKFDDGEADGIFPLPYLGLVVRM